MRGRITRMKRVLFICLVLICSIILGSCYKSQESNASKERKTIEFIVKMRSGEHWNLVKMGVREAASEFDVNVNFMAPDYEQEIYEQERLINSAIERKVDAIVLAASDYNGLVSVVEKAHKNKIPVIIIDSSVNTDKITGKVSTNNFEAGKLAAKKLIKLTGEEAKVGILNFVKESESAQKREEGIINAFSKHAKIEVVAKEYCYSNERLAATQTKNMISLFPNINGIITLNSAASIGAAQAIEEMGLTGKVKLVTFDSTMMGIQYLESGVIQATVAQNPVAMGYLGVRYAAMAAEGLKIPTNIEIDSKLVDRNTMYFPDNQKFIFPFIK